MDKMPETRTLLAQYVTDGSEPAFCELVNRYVDLVYSTALRLMRGDTHSAQDVTQIVFATLAQKAHVLGGELTLGGWLHQNTRFVAAKMLRAEFRRRAREQKAVEMNQLENGSQAQLSHVLAVLDEAIGQLRSADQTAIVLRFFEQQDLRSVGLALGTNEEAARKRVARALDKLQGLLRRKGVVLSAAGLGSILAGGVVTSAPAGLAGIIAGNALAGAAASGMPLILLKTLAMTKLKLGIASAIAVLGLATIIVKQEQAKHKLRAELSRLSTEMRPAAPAPAPQIAKSEPPPKFDWREVESTNYQTYIQHLRAIGCPDQTIRDIVLADVNAVFDAKEKTAQRANRVEFWHPAYHPLTQNVRERFQEIHNQFETDRTAVLKQLLGDGVPIARRPLDVSDKDLKIATLDFIPQEQRDTFADRITEVEKPFMDRFSPKLEVSDWHDQDRAEYGKYLQDRSEQLVKLLGPTGKDEYDLRVSLLAGKMRATLPGVDMSEEQFRQIYSFAKQYEMLLNPFFINTDDPAQLKAFTDAQNVVAQKAREVLGDNVIDNRPRTSFEAKYGLR